MERSAAAALVILLASAYSQHSAHERLVGALGTRIALLEKQADDARAQDAHERVLLRGALEKLTVTLEGQAAQVNAREWVNETASAIMTEMEHHADVRHLRELLVLSGLLIGETQFDFRRAHQAGFTFAQVFEAVDEANCPRHECLLLLKQAGYTEPCTEYLGDANFQMANAICREEEVGSLLARLKSDGASFEEAKAALLDGTTSLATERQRKREREESFERERESFREREGRPPRYDMWRTNRVLRMAGYSCADAHSTIDDLNSKWTSWCGEDEQDESVSESCAKLGRVFLQTLRDGRAFCQTPEEIAGIMRDMGLSAAVYAGYTPDEMRRAGYSMQEVARASLVAAHSPYHSDRAHAPQQLHNILIELKAAGLTCTEARHANFRPTQCKSAGYTFEEAKQAGYAYFELHWNRGDETESVHHHGWDVD